jgi:1,4-alpha-glucan branching enzyme
MVPTSFWDSARTELDKLKPMFMLAEAEEPELMKHAFDMYYDWSLFHLMNDIAKGNKKANEIPNYYTENIKKFPNALNMVFTSNHDENSWNGTVFERMPDSYKTFAALTFIMPDMPLIYNGQEACLNKRLSFFDKDTIDWKSCDMTDLYKKLIEIKHQNPALWGKKDATNLQFINNTNEQNILLVSRKNKDNTILAIFNLSNSNQKYSLDNQEVTGKYTNLLNNNKEEIKNNEDYNMQAWEFKILQKNNE